MVKIFWSFFWYSQTISQTFLPPQVKRRVIINNKNGIYELPHKWPKTEYLRKLGAFRKSLKVQV